MPNRWAVASGNWSNTATWNSGATLGLPTASDDVYANRFNIILDQDISVNVLAARDLAGTASHGGTFITSGSRTIETFGSGTYGGFWVQVGSLSPITSSCALVVTGSDTVNIKAVRIASAPNAGGALPTSSIAIKSSGITNISASNSIQGITGPAISISSGSAGVSGGTCNIQTPVILGDTFGGGGAQRMAIVMGAINGYTINITGSVQDGSNFQGNGILNGSAGTTNLVINISGSIISDSNVNPILLSAGSTTVNVTGSVATTGSSTAAAISVTSGIFANININGNVISGVASAVISVLPGTSSISGSIYASPFSPGVQFTSATHLLNASGPFYNSGGRNAVYAPIFQLISGSTPTWTFDTETYAEQRTLYTQNYPGNFPSASNVRQGIVFGDTNQFTGTVAIPPTGSVLKGVPVDNTTGSASFDVQSVWNIDTNNLTTTGSLGVRLKNVATVATDGAAIASKGNL